MELERFVAPEVPVEAAGAPTIYPSLRPRYGEEAWRRVFAALGLSARERQLVCRVFRDQRESDMALSLGLSPTTIHTYLRRLYRKLSVTSRVGLVLRVVAEHQRPIRVRGTEGMKW